MAKRQALEHVKKYQWILLIVITIHFFLFSTLGLWRHWGYITALTDLGCFDQAIWTALNYNSLLNTPIYSGQINWLGHHFNPILYLFVPLYYLIPSVNWFIISQSAALSLAALPIFLLAKQVTQSEKQALIWAVIFLINPYLINAAIWDFHPVSLAVPLIALGLLAIEQKRLLLFTIANLTLILCQEQLGLTVASMGLLYGLKNHHWRISSIFMFIGILSMVFILGFIMPALSPTKQHVMFSHNLGQLSRYSWLGDSVTSVLKRLCLEPLAVMQTVFVGMEGWHYVFWLFVPFLFLPIGSLFWVLPASGDLLANLLSANPMPRGFFSYHSVTIIPLLTVAAIHGLQKLSPFLKLFSPAGILKSLLLLNLMLAYFVAPFPLPGAVNFWKPVNTVAAFDERELVVKKIIANQSISVQANLGAHFTHRPLIYRFPEKKGEVDSIVLRLESPTQQINPNDPGIIGTLAYHLQMPPATYLDQVEKLLISKDYELVYWNDPWLLFSKGQKGTSLNTLPQIRSKIQTLRKKWIMQPL